MLHVHTAYLNPHISLIQPKPNPYVKHNISHISITFTVIAINCSLYHNRGYSILIRKVAFPHFYTSDILLLRAEGAARYVFDAATAAVVVV